MLPSLNFPVDLNDANGERVLHRLRVEFRDDHGGRIIRRFCGQAGKRQLTAVQGKRDILARSQSFADLGFAVIPPMVTLLPGQKYTCE